MARLFTGALLLYVLTVPLYVAWHGDVNASWVALAAGLGGILFLRVADVIELTLGPVTAKLKEKTEEAAATIDQVRGLASKLGEVTIAVLAAAGSSGGMGYQAKFTYKALVERELRSLGLGDEELLPSRKVWHEYLAYEHGLRILNSIGTVFSLGAPDLQDLCKSDLQVAPPDEWRRVLSRHGFLGGQTAENVTDLEHYLATGKLRRPSVWNVEEPPAYGARTS